MADMLKITSPIGVKNRIDNLPKRQPTDAIFDIFNSNRVNQKVTAKTDGAEGEDPKQSLLQNLHKEFFQPLLNETKAQSDAMRKLILMARLFQTSSGALPEDFLDKLFVRPKELLTELLTREKGETVFQGEFFDSLRLLAKLEGQPKLKEAIVNILKYFDSHVNQENSLKSILSQSESLLKNLTKSQAELVRQQMDQLSTMVKLDKNNYSEINNFLKNSFVPTLADLVKGYNYTEKGRDSIMAVIHHIVRFDRGEPKLLEEALLRLGEELKPLTKLSDADILDMKKLLFQHAREARERGTESSIIDKLTLEKFGIKADDNDMASLLNKALDRAAPAKLSSVAQTLLQYILQNESPVMPLMHFMIPIRFRDENTYGEFFVDKDCQERKGDAQEAKSIYFIIQSDKFGNFEVDLLARDQMIDLDIRCPELLLDSVKSTKAQLKAIIEDQGYRLANYQVGVYTEGQTILQRYPKLALRKVGIDVKI